MWFKKYQIETPFKCNNVKVLIKCEIVKKKCSAYFSILFCFFFIEVTKQSLGNGFYVSL